MRLTQAAIAHPAIGDATGGDATKLDAALREYGPLCCLIGDEALAPIYAEAGVTPP